MAKTTDVKQRSVKLIEFVIAMVILVFGWGVALGTLMADVKKNTSDGESVHRELKVVADKQTVNEGRIVILEQQTEAIDKSIKAADQKRDKTYEKVVRLEEKMDYIIKFIEKER